MTSANVIRTTGLLFFVGALGCSAEGPMNMVDPDASSVPPQAAVDEPIEPPPLQPDDPSMVNDGPGEQVDDPAEQPPAETLPEENNCVAPLGDTPPDLETLESCCGGTSYCVAEVPEKFDLFGNDTCSDGSTCLPEPFVSSGGEFTPQACVSIADVAGRCISICAPEVTVYVDILPQADCEPTERCVPCISPIDDTDTGACYGWFGCDDVEEPIVEDPPEEPADPEPPEEDPPVEEPPPEPTCEGPLGDPPPAIDTLEACCGGTSHCIAEVPQKFEFHGSDSCSDGGYCVPDNFIVTGGVYTPKTCSSVGGAGGRCLSLCAPNVAAKAALLPQDVCQPNERCVPCISPLDGSDTKACHGWFTCDEVTEPEPLPEPVEIACPYEGDPIVEPTSLPSCPSCGGGHCVSKDSVSPEQMDLLSPCDADTMCVPDVGIATAGNFILDTCESIAGAEGRCLSTCLPSVAAKVDKLPQSSCPTEHRCVPCTDPISGDDTGACALGCDPGPKEPPVELPGCCNSIGTCLPSELMSEEQLESLDSDTCPADGGEMICVPDAFLAGPHEPQSCKPSWGVDALGLWNDKYEEGGCIPECLPAVSGLFNQILLAQGDCPAEFVCAPCYKPPFGKWSGACDVVGAPESTGACLGKCGGKSDGDCWCDDQCAEYGDCCEDACPDCGFCAISEGP